MISQAKFDICKKKSFLVSKPKDCPHYLEYKDKLEDTHGAKIGAGNTKEAIIDFLDDKPIGCGQLITVEDLGFSHNLFETDAGLYDVLFQKYAKATKYGVLILVGTLDNFKKWTASKACRKEVEGIPEGRLFAYIEHTPEDNPTDLGYIVHIDAENCDASATVEDGIGYILWNDGQYYHGELRDGIRSGLGTEGYLEGDKYCYYDGEWEEGMYHGKGKKTYANGDVYTGPFFEDQMHGKGIFTFANGDVLESEWVHGE
jgi:hypothetical protein